MRHPPGPTRSLALAVLLAVLWLSAPSPAGADTATATSVTPATSGFYASRLQEHNGVFVAEELAGLIDRERTADDLHDLIGDHGADLDVVVIAAHGEYAATQDLARAVHARTERPLVVLAVDDLRIGAADLSAASIPDSAVGYATATGGWNEDPVDKLERLLRMADHPEGGALANQAWAEFHARSDVVTPGREPHPDDADHATLHAREHKPPALAGAAAGALAVYLVVTSALRLYRVLRRTRREEAAS